MILLWPGWLDTLLRGYFIDSYRLMHDFKKYCH